MTNPSAKSGCRKGYKPSEETKKRMAQTRRERRDGLILPQASRGVLPVELRYEVFMRDREACAGCGDQYLVPDGKKSTKMRVNSGAGISIVPLPEGEEITEAAQCATLCSPCRKTARLMKIRRAERIADQLAGMTL
jgi:5-methylcytosine-specific restriction endonuclease McrA